VDPPTATGADAGRSGSNDDLSLPLFLSLGGAAVSMSRRPNMDTGASARRHGHRSEASTAASSRTRTRAKQTVTWHMDRGGAKQSLLTDLQVSATKRDLISIDLYSVFQEFKMTGLVLHIMCDKVWSKFKSTLFFFSSKVSVVLQFIIKSISL
jgi:hypothetical protein